MINARFIEARKIFPADRMAEGMWTTVELLEALDAGDTDTAKNILDECDGPPSLLACAALVMVAVRRDSSTLSEFMEGARERLPIPGIDNYRDETVKAE